MKKVPCAGCGRPIVWAVDAAGQRIPLDPRPAVYLVTDRGETEAPGAARAVSAMVSHFATCPEASRFSGSKPARVQDQRNTSAKPGLADR